MPTSKAPKRTIELTTRQFRDLVEPVMPLAGRDDMSLPVLCTIWIRSTPVAITATATDRFRVGISRIAPTDPPQSPVDFMIRTVDVRRILSIFKGTRFSDPALSFTLEDNELRVRSTEGFDGLAGASLRLALPDGEYPKVDSLFTEALTSTEDRADSVGVNAAFFADFKAAVRNGDPLLIRPGASPGKGILVACGDHFIGLIMPRRLIGGDSTGEVASVAAAWSDILPAVKKEAVA